MSNEKDFLRASKPVIVDSKEFSGCTVFRRVYFYHTEHVGDLIYAVTSNLSPDAISGVIKKIPVNACAEFMHRVALENAITGKDIYDELREQLSDEKYKDVSSGEFIEICNQVFMYSDRLSHGLLDRTLPVEEALAKWINDIISRCYTMNYSSE